MLELDARIFLFVNQAHCPFGDWFFRSLTDFGNFKIPLIIAIIVLLWKGDSRLRATLILAVCAVALSDALGNTLKHIVERPRPFWILEDARLLVGKSRSGSFPSNHATNLFAVASLISLEYRRKLLVVPALLVATLVAYSRVYVGVHYPLDVAGGAALGAACGLLVFSLNRKWPFLRRRDDGRLALDYWGLLWLVFALSFAYRISRIAGGDHQLFAEEAQYWEWSRRLALSYYSKPPLIAFIIRLGTALFGHTEFGVRVGALAATTALTVLTGFFAWSLGRSARVVFFAVLFLSLSPLFAVASVVHTTDTPVGLFWGLTLYLVYLAVFHDKKRMWYAAGFAFGLGLLSKYAMVYLIPCAGLFLLMSKPDRRWLKRREPWLALLIGLLVFSPVIWWNWRNGFASFLHVSEQVATKSGFQLRPDKFFEFVGSQFGVVSPVLFGAMLWVAWAVLSRRALRENRPYLFLLCVSLPIFLMILFKSMLGKVQANWAALSYYAWLLLVVHYFSDLYERTRGTKTARRIVGWTFAALLTAGLITTLIHESSFIRSKSVASLLERVGVKSPHKLDPEWRALGWKELGKRLNSMIARAPSPERVFLVSTRYQDAALTAFYTKGNPPSYNVNYGRRMNQYDIWPGPAERAGWDAILITLMDNKAVRDHGRMSQSFERSDPPELVELRIKGRVYHTYMVSMHYGFLGKFAFERVPESH